MADEEILFLSNEQVRQVLPMAEVIDAMEGAFIQLSEGQARVPVRTNIEIQEHKASALFMPVYLPELDLIACKTVTVCEKNIERNRPMIHAMIMVMEAATGSPVAMMNAECLTAMRTGAASGLATRLLAREDAEVAAIVGTGAQGHTQLEAVACVRGIKKVLALDKSEQAARSFADEMSQKLNVPVEVIQSARQLQEADIICTATSSYSPVFQDEDIRQGVHINAVGAFKPTMREITSETVARAKIVVDSREACLAEAGDIIIPINLGYISRRAVSVELGELVAGTKKGRESELDITLFKTVGNAVQDLAAAALVIRKARDLNIGQRLKA